VLGVLFLLDSSIGLPWCFGNTDGFAYFQWLEMMQCHNFLSTLVQLHVLRTDMVAVSMMDNELSNPHVEFG
jgi:hypothetical protein